MKKDNFKGSFEPVSAEINQLANQIGKVCNGKMFPTVMSAFTCVLAHTFRNAYPDEQERNIFIDQLAELVKRTIQANEALGTYNNNNLN